MFLPKGASLPTRGKHLVNSSGGGKRKSSGISRTAVLMLVTAVPSFFLGTLWSASKDPKSLSPVELLLLCREHTQRALDHHAETEEAAQAANSLLPAATLGRYAVAMSRVGKQEFTDTYDLGVPLDPPSAGAEEILILYSNEKAMPSSFSVEDMNSVPTINMPEAVEHCEYMNILLTDHGRRNQCIAIMPQYESYHLQKWMRLNEKGSLDGTKELQMVSRGHTDKGRDNFAPPELEEHTRPHWTMLSRYFATVDEVLAELKPILARVARQNTVIVMVCNYGQSELLMNFVCAARRRNLDLSNIIVFTTDQETTDIATSLGLTAYFDHRNFGDIPKEAARRYGDSKFVAMMMAKVICVQLVSMLGYDLLFQDVDIIWYKQPLDYFLDSSLPASQYDVFFQDDGGHSVRYAPYSANSGFYFVRYNERTRHFLTSLLMVGDLVLKTDSHQQALIATLNEHVSLYGLKAKVLSRDTDEFPGGFHFHQHSKAYMKRFFAGEVEPYIFHMSWTLNKNNKLFFLRQMGEWYVQEACIHHTVSEIGADPLIPTCCAAEPLFSCHYRDKPSLEPCKDSPSIDKGRPSWW